MVTVKIQALLWGYWAELAIDHERSALEFRRQNLAAANRDIDYASELKASMVSISASAHALDAFYAVFRDAASLPQRAAWKRSGIKRRHQILETLKASFVVNANPWVKELDWLFDLRDAAVHPNPDFKEPAPHPLGSSSAQEYVMFSAESATRAVNLLLDVIEKCGASPKPLVMERSERVRDQVAKLRSRRTDP